MAAAAQALFHWSPLTLRRKASPIPNNKKLSHANSYYSRRRAENKTKAVARESSRPSPSKDSLCILLASPAVWHETENHAAFPDPPPANHSHNPSNTDPTLVSFVWCLSPFSPKKPTRRVCHPCCGRHTQRTCKWTSAAAATSRSTRCDASSWSNISKTAVELCPPPFPALGAEKISRNRAKDQTDRKPSKFPEISCRVLAATTTPLLEFPNRTEFPPFAQVMPKRNALILPPATEAVTSPHSHRFPPTCSTPATSGGAQTWAQRKFQAYSYRVRVVTFHRSQATGHPLFPRLQTLYTLPLSLAPQRRRRRQRYVQGCVLCRRETTLRRTRTPKKNMKVEKKRWQESQKKNESPSVGLHRLRFTAHSPLHTEIEDNCGT